MFLLLELLYTLFKRVLIHFAIILALKYIVIKIKNILMYKVFVVFHDGTNQAVFNTHDEALKAIHYYMLLLPKSISIYPHD